MNPTAIKVIRWILVLPAALAAALVAQLLAAVEQIFLQPWIVDLNIKFFMAAAFVAAGARVAPTAHPWPAASLLTLQVLGAVSGIALTWMDDVNNTWWESFLCIVVILGAVGGFSYARANAKEADLEPNPNEA